MGDTPDEQLFKAIKEGGLAVNKSALMPAWGSVLTDAQITEMVGYLRKVCHCGT
jgi:mono/diheme cytochrome c family protein